MKLAQLSRRAFLRGQITPKSIPLRPPWAIAEADFLQTCTRCGDCVRLCPTKIIVAGDAGFPQIDFGQGECTFCRHCVDACTPMALHWNEASPAWSYRATIDDSCLAKQGVVCRTCGDACAVQAIRFSPQLGGAALPRLQLDACTGCGACVALCPSQAIAIKPS